MRRTGVSRYSDKGTTYFQLRLHVTELVMIGVCKLAMLVPSDGISPTGRQQVRVHLTVEVT